MDTLETSLHVAERCSVTEFKSELQQFFMIFLPMVFMLKEYEGFGNAGSYFCANLELNEEEKQGAQHSYISYIFLYFHT